ncbi:DUF5753 domain-containing protein [Streptomyces sp. NPDC019531]|uniref:DUF5753 domain-containing protein n=1 Tax=Streptomyces sp. NPDC019531 TaxID=3365062 RepID=UPI00384E7629
MPDPNDVFDALLEETSLGSRGARQLRSRTPAVRARAVRAIPGWWHRYSDRLPHWFSTFVSLESAASLIRTYELYFVPGLLQTDAYARAVIQHGMVGATEADIDRRVEVRLERQKLLVTEDAPQLHVVLDEAALRRPYGNRETMRDQIRHLIEMSQWENVQLQVLPLNFCGHPSGCGAFTIMSLPDLPDIVYLEQLTSALYLEGHQEVAQYRKVLTELQEESPDPDESRNLLGDLLFRS